MDKFYFLTHQNTNPYFNLASEEYLLKHKTGYYMYLWINEPAVIVGVNQNAIEEVNLNFVQDNGIKVVRRMTGGGAVYHDLNNLCYTVIAPNNTTENPYKEFSRPVVEYLNSIGIKAEFSGRNDLTIEGKKISGNAQTVYKDRILHHGTLLFDTDLTVLEKALNPNKLKMQSKGIKSVRSRVTDIKSNLKKDMTLQEFRLGLEQFFLKSAEKVEFTNQDICEIEKLVKDKYSTYDWNIGYSPKGQNVFERKFDFGVLKITFDTIQGQMQNVNITGDFFELKDVKEFINSLIGVEFTLEKVEKAFANVNEYIQGANAKQIVSSLFE